MRDSPVITSISERAFRSAPGMPIHAAEPLAGNFGAIARMHLSHTPRNAAPATGSATPAAALDRVFAMISDLIVVTQRDGVILLVNPAWEETLGWTERELVGRSVFELVHPDDRAGTGALGAS